MQMIKMERDRERGEMWEGIFVINTKQKNNVMVIKNICLIRCSG